MSAPDTEPQVSVEELDRLEARATGGAFVTCCCHPDLPDDIPSTDEQRACVIDIGIPDQCDQSDPKQRSPVTDKTRCAYWLPHQYNKPDGCSAEETLALIATARRAIATGAGRDGEGASTPASQEGSGEALRGIPDAVLADPLASEVFSELQPHQRMLIGLAIKRAVDALAQPAPSQSAKPVSEGALRCALIRAAADLMIVKPGLDKLVAMGQTDVNDFAAGIVVPLRKGDVFSAAEFPAIHAGQALREVERALSLLPTAEAKPDLASDVVRLVIAAREVQDEEASPESLKRLDQAAEAFASRVPWENEPEEAKPDALRSPPTLPGVGEITKLIDDWFSPWGSWKTAWWEMEVSDAAELSADNLLREVRKRIAALSTPPLPAGDRGADLAARSPVTPHGDAREALALIRKARQAYTEASKRDPTGATEADRRMSQGEIEDSAKEAFYEVLCDLEVRHADAILAAGWTPSPTQAASAPASGDASVMWLRPEGKDFAAWREHVRRSELYRQGDTVLVWVNEGDLYLPPMVPCPAPASPSPARPDVEDGV